MLYISHYLEEVMRIADRITVMRDSRTVLDDVAASTVDLDHLVEAMIGGSLATPADRVDIEPEAVEDRDNRRLRLVDVEVPDALDGVTLHVSPGEVVGVAGLQGAGHAEVLRVVCGQVRPSRRGGAACRAAYDPCPCGTPSRTASGWCPATASPSG